MHTERADYYSPALLCARLVGTFMTPLESVTLTQLSIAELVLLLREELKHNWKTGERTRVEDLLAKWPQAKIPEEGILDLIYQEIVVREEMGDQTALEEYQQRFPALETALQRQFALHQMLKNSQLANFAEPANATVTFKQSIYSAAEQSLALGAKIRHYQLEGKLGEGAMGIVFKARDEQLQRTVALKLMKGQEHASKDQLHRFRVEAELLAQLQHPNIVQIFEIGDHEGTSFFAMEYVAGTTLQQQVREHPLIPIEAARLVHLLAEAMHAVHQRGIIHRDLKPSNVLLSTEQIPKITDFGLARQGQSDVTVSGVIMGTPSYMAPEQAMGELDRIGPAADVYALGAILFELLTGRAPFRGATVPLTLQMVVHNDPPAPRSLQPGIPRDLETICLKCLQKDPTKRFASALALAEDLQRFMRGEPIHARPVGWLESLVKWARREKKVARLVAFAVVVTLVGILAVSYMWQAERRARQDVEKQSYFGLIVTADSQLAKGKFAWAAETLAKCPESLRDWEWRHLDYRCQEAIPLQASMLGLMGSPLGHGPLLTAPALFREPGRVEMPEGVNCLATHPDQTSFVAGCFAEEDAIGVLVIFDGDPKPHILNGHQGTVNWLAFSPDGSEFFSGGRDGVIRGWKLAIRERFMVFLDHQRPIACIAVHPQEPWVASTAFNNPKEPHPDDSAVFVWHRQTGKRIHTLRKHSKTVTGVAFHPDGKLLATASHDQTIMLWDCQTGTIVRVLHEHRFPIACIEFSPDGALLASSASPTIINRPGDEEIFVWDTATGAVLHRMEGHDARILDLAFAPGGKRLATAGKDHQVKLWDVQTGHEVLTLVGHRDFIPTLAFDRHGSLLTGSLDKSIRIWKTTSGK
jgi:eukaryotic-like serine/threonine-protein kinase